MEWFVNERKNVENKLNHQKFLMTAKDKVNFVLSDEHCFWKQFLFRRMENEGEGNPS